MNQIYNGLNTMIDNMNLIHNGMNPSSYMN